jgi:Zn-dependent peptidase ImmA (M78 family)
VRRGFQSEATALAAATREELGVSPFERLNPRHLAHSLTVPVINLSDMQAEAPSIRHLLTVEPEVFSAVTVFAGPRRTIVHNDGHRVARQNSNLAHELGHALLQHPPTPALDDSGCRIWDQDIEDEATWLAGCLLMTPEAALATARGHWTVEEAAEHFGISEQMVNYRINKTGARVRVQRAQAARTSLA